MEIENVDRCFSIRSVTGDGIFNIVADHVTKIVQDENSLLVWFHEVTEDWEPWDMEYIFDTTEDATLSRELLEKEVRLTKMSRIK